jgi:hypothetical protein
MPASSVTATQSLEANTRSKKTASPPAQETHCLLHKKSSKAVDFTSASHPKSTPRTGHCQQSNRSPLRRNGNWKIARRDPPPEILPARTEIPKITDQRLGRASLTRGNVADSHAPGNNTPETRLPVWGGRIRTSGNQNTLAGTSRTAQGRNRRLEGCDERARRLPLPEFLKVSNHGP